MKMRRRMSMEEVRAHMGYGAKFHIPGEDTEVLHSLIEKIPTLMWFWETDEGRFEVELHGQSNDVGGWQEHAFYEY